MEKFCSQASKEANKALDILLKNKSATEIIAKPKNRINVNLLVFLILFFIILSLLLSAQLL
jgi:hypothetical protein